MRHDAQCGHCGSIERQRFLWLYLTDHTDLFDGSPKRVLHFAPEERLSAMLRRRLGKGYLTADLMRDTVDVKVDVTDIRFPDGSFDFIICSHVLEHVGDDGLAMRELVRVLAPGGLALLLLPITADTTFEDPTIVSPEERLRVFGQADHVRRYGPDVVGRLEAAGFAVSVVRSGDLYGEEDIERMGLHPPIRSVFVGSRAPVPGEGGRGH